MAVILSVLMFHGSSILVLQNHCFKLTTLEGEEAAERRVVCWRSMCTILASPESNAKKRI
jgi:hypothetical protein